MCVWEFGGVGGGSGERSEAPCTCELQRPCLEHTHRSARALCSQSVAIITFIAVAGPCCVALEAVGSTLWAREHIACLVRLAAARAQQGVMHVQAAAPMLGARLTGAQVLVSVRV